MFKFDRPMEAYELSPISPMVITGGVVIIPTAEGLNEMAKTDRKTAGQVAMGTYHILKALRGL